MKKLLMILSGLFIVAAIAVVAVLFQLNGLVKMAIDKYGSEVMGVEVSVGMVAISPFSGDGSLSSFAIGNPDGYKADKSFKAAKISIKIDEASLRTDTIIVQEVTIDSPDIFYEVAGNSNNFTKLQHNIKENLKKQYPDDSAGSLDDKVIIINDLYIKHGSVLVTAPELGNQSFKVALHDIHMHNLGKGDKPGNLSKIMQRVMGVITDDVMNTVGNITIDNFAKALTQGGIINPLNDVQKTVEGIIPGIGNILPH